MFCITTFMYVHVFMNRILFTECVRIVIFCLKTVYYKKNLTLKQDTVDKIAKSKYELHLK